MIDDGLQDISNMNFLKPIRVYPLVRILIISTNRPKIDLDMDLDMDMDLDSSDASCETLASR